MPNETSQGETSQGETSQEIEDAAHAVNAQQETKVVYRPGSKRAPQNAEDERGIASPQLVKEQSKRSFFDDDPTAPASSIKLDGETFFYNALSDKVKAFVITAPERLADSMGLTIEELNDEDTLLTPEQRYIQQEHQLKLHEAVLSDALCDWTLTDTRTGRKVNCSEERKQRLHPDLKRNIADAITAFTTQGLSGERFLILYGFSNSGTGSRQRR